MVEFCHAFPNAFIARGAASYPPRRTIGPTSVIGYSALHSSPCWMHPSVLLFLDLDDTPVLQVESSGGLSTTLNPSYWLGSVLLLFCIWLISPPGCNSGGEQSSSVVGGLCSAVDQWGGSHSSCSLARKSCNFPHCHRFLILLS